MPRLICVLLTIVLFSACKKNPVEPIVQAPEPKYVDEFKPCACDSVAGNESAGLQEYIRAEVNGVPICADGKGGFADSWFPNHLRYGTIIRQDGRQYFDNVYMIRYTKDRQWMIGIFLENTHALTKTYPYELPRSNPEYCEIGEIQLENQNQLTNNSCMFCSWSDWHYYGQFFAQGPKLIVDRFENDVFEGRFSGRVRTGSGRTAMVTNGQFRIRLDKREEEIDVR
ncbi:MAG: hypothetical protein EOO05_14205 [Chitinophagaceae bacterium]|nr:MAG: hypothetical protein EOO05_14205 [Chitinophagaceae bacterium]